MYTPFISGVGTEKINPSKLSDVIPVNQNLVTTVPQFISTDPREIILLGKTLRDYGYDHINWNLGCPFSRIANKKRGCGMLPFPDELDKILDTVFKDFPLKLSIKTRLGYYSPREIKPVIEVLNNYPVHLMILHPRIGTQIYRGQVDLDGFSESLSECRLPIAYNGDVYHSARYKELQTLFPQVTTWMLGRGALINPFLAREIKGEIIEDSIKRTIIHNFNNELLTEAKTRIRNEKRLLGSLKAVWYYMAGMFNDGKQEFSIISKSQSIESFLKATNNIIDQAFADNLNIENYFKKGINHIGNEE